MAYGASSARISHPTKIPASATIGPKKIINGTGIKDRRKLAATIKPPTIKKGMVAYFTNTVALNIIFRFSGLQNLIAAMILTTPKIKGKNIK